LEAKRRLYYSESSSIKELATIERALELGHNFLDTADYYRMGHNEELISQAIKGKRDKAFLSVKTGQLLAPGPNKSISPGPVNTHPDYIRNAVLFSLQRLKTDYIDLYTPARVDPNVPIEDTVGALSDLIKKGVVRYIGLSEAAATTIRKAAAVHPITALQIEYSLWSRDIEAEVLPTIRELGIGLIEKIKTLATEKGCTPSQLAIAWVLAQGEDIITIPGTKRIKY
jgi:aryl-alcohol dehydrogenase-like predicted oxidoreductase